MLCSQKAAHREVERLGVLCRPREIAPLLVRPRVVVGPLTEGACQPGAAARRGEFLPIFARCRARGGREHAPPPAGQRPEELPYETR